MANQWPEYGLDSSNLQDSFQLAREFELQCTKVFDHAARHPTDAASADYVMQFAAQAYQAVHSLYIQKLSSSYWDLKVATSELESRAIDYREGRDFQLPNHIHPGKVLTPLGSQENDNLTVDANESTSLNNTGKEDYDEEEEESEDDDDWEESEEETDDEYYEYYEGSDADSELEALATLDTNNAAPHNAATGPSEGPEIHQILSTSEGAPLKDPSPPPPTTSIFQDQAMHDRITAALQQISIPLEDQNQAPIERTETQTTKIAHPPVYSITPPITPPADDTQSEATAVQTQSNQEPAREPPAMKRKSFDAVQIHHKLPSDVPPNGIPRRLKTVCYKYMRRAMVPIRGKSH
ncbi:hypothetical protein N7456_002693 [Penicillium angulare]|uniref:Uncharacterized protein n=1 Tax=Penicillium angulare TaxID=116970 RepID=A0A9W9G8L5_9EURO|nr:hypothetical protein N7456_002693 [Penicillium angulare]